MAESYKQQTDLQSSERFQGEEITEKILKKKNATKKRKKKKKSTVMAVSNTIESEDEADRAVTEKLIQVKNETENAWRPARLNNSTTLTEDEMKTALLYKKVRGVLNKLTPEKFDKLLNQVQDLTIDNAERLQGVVDLVFEKAVDDPNFSVAYANMCKELAIMQVPADSRNKSDTVEYVKFHKLLITKCQIEFEKNSIDEEAHDAKLKEIEGCTDLEKKKELQLLLEEEDRRMRVKSVGNIRFIGELFKVQMLTVNIMLRCINILLDNKDENSLECLCKLLTTIGKDLEQSKKQDLTKYFEKMQEIADKKHGKISNRVRFMLQDVIDLRNSKWVMRRQDRWMTMMCGHISLADTEQINIQMNSGPINTPRKDDRLGGGSVGGSDRKRRINASDDGWMTTTRGRASQYFESSKLMNKPPPMNEMTLGSKNLLGVQGRVSIKKQTHHVPVTTTANMYAVLKKLYGPDLDKSRSGYDIRINKDPYVSKGPSMEHSYNKNYDNNRGSRSGSQHRSSQQRPKPSPSPLMKREQQQPPPQQPPPQQPPPQILQLTTKQFIHRIQNIKKRKKKSTVMAVSKTIESDETDRAVTEKLVQVNNETENAWRPARLNNSATLTEDEMKTALLYKKVTGILNKLTPEKFDKLLNQVQDLTIDNAERIQGVVDLVFEKAVDDPNFSVAYANMCKELAIMQMPVPADSRNKSDTVKYVSFRKLLIPRCQIEFEKNFINEKARDAKLKEIEECKDPEKKKELQLLLEEEDRRMRVKSVGNIRFIGELFKQQMLTVNIMLRYINILLDNKDENSLECLCKLLTTIGKDLEQSKKQDLTKYFEKMQEIADKKHGKISNRVRFMLQDVIDLRNSKWVMRRQDRWMTMMCGHISLADTEQINIQMNSGPSMEHSYNKNYDDNRGSRSGSQHCSSQQRPTPSPSPSMKREQQQPPPQQPPPQIPQLTTEQFKHRIQNIIEEYTNDCLSTSECILDIKQSIEPSKMQDFVLEGYNNVIDCSTTARNKTGKLFAHLIKNQVLSLDDYCKSLKELLSVADDLVIDVPMLWDYLAEMIVPLIIEDVLTLDRLCSCMDILVTQKHSHKLLAQLLKQLCTEKGFNYVVDIWQSSGVNFTDFMSADLVNSFIKDNKFDFMVCGADPDKSRSGYNMRINKDPYVSKGPSMERSGSCSGKITQSCVTDINASYDALKMENYYLKEIIKDRDILINILRQTLAQQNCNNELLKNLLPNNNNKKDKCCQTV